ncbi:MAG TPA: triose-phosphate isomerase [Clostridium sp.]|uniref:triose-phosphate isomerase n=1 Tax=Clostridium sp. TaxID=1506 RepID=UPI002F95997F
MKTSKLFLGTNLKMYKNIKDTVFYLNELTAKTKDISRKEFELFVIPSFTSLSEASKIVNKDLIKLGAQNMSWVEQGQFTGEISPLMLQELDIDIIQIGHSERRHVFGEDDTSENKKVICALNHNFTVLLCVGETLEQKNYNVSNEVLRMQLKIDFADVPKDCIDKIRVAYEPVWAIGVNGIPASTEYAAEKHGVIKDTLLEIFGEAGNQIPVLYGGSVNIDNAFDLIAQPTIDGLFIGRYAWEADQFEKLIRGIAK